MSKIDEEAATWAARLDRGLDHTEEAALSDWLSADRRHQGALLRCQATMSLLDRGRILAAAVGEEIEAADVASPERRRFLWAGGATAALLAAGVALGLWPRGQGITTEIGEIRNVPLEDGSIAVVNSGSHLRVAYNDSRRDLSLSEGEAWFQVAKNHDRPFVVSAGPAFVRAVGTAFDVRRGAARTEILVTEGTVQIWAAGSRSAPISIRAGHQATIASNGSIEQQALSPFALDQRLAWREGKIILDNMPLWAAAQEFNRYHRVQLQVDPAFSSRTMVGWFGTDDLEGFAQAAAAIVGGRLERDGKTLRIKK
ncbi:FecR domain-containing protein [Sphingobium sp.]|uniref:FecR family protein n=1 Tax=Sphingobium sp. TaxID=1912891 RepID=UPI0026399194|nr:FecR domain-containing protein [Sphingobium sp.]